MLQDQDSSHQIGQLKIIVLKYGVCKMRTQRKENYYYVFWTVAMVAFIVPQVFTAYAYMSIKNLLDKPIKVEYVNEKIRF